MPATYFKLICRYFLTVFFIFLILQAALAQDIPKEKVFAKHKYLPGYGFRKAHQPEVFQGNRQKRKYFEGWYFKLVSANSSDIISIIPGIALSKDGKVQHAFIQIIDGKTSSTAYYSFPIEKFSFSKEKFAIKIDENYFSTEQIILNIKTDSSRVYGKIDLTNHVKLKSHIFLNSGIMGWYRFVPFMECYHGVVSLNNCINGNIALDGKSYIFSNGTGYIEKDWGRSMPAAWIWMQTNQFTRQNNSFMLSVANVPWMGKSFTGFLGFFLHNNTIYRFATYTHAKLSIDLLDDNETKITIRDRKLRYSIVAIRKQAGLLKAPVNGSMDRRIPESIDTKLILTVNTRKGIEIFKDSTNVAGFELVGNPEILKTIKK